MQQHPLDERFPEWGEGIYFTVEIAQTIELHWLLSHLYVLIPVLDNDKHYWIGEDEVQKLLRHGEEWLAGHPEKELIVERYLRYRHALANRALEKLLVEAGEPDEEAEPAEEKIERPMSLNDQRHNAVIAALKAEGATRVLDLGCSTGNLLRRMLEEKSFEKIVGMDVSYRSLELAAKRLHLDRLSEKQRARIELIHGSLIYRDARLLGYDAAVLVEVIEHLDLNRLASLERVVFEFTKPRVVIVTTPNVEFNVKFETLASGSFRHGDHRFEWTRAEFEEWGKRVAERFGYGVRFVGVGEEDPVVGSATQMGVFVLGDDASRAAGSASFGESDHDV